MLCQTNHQYKVELNKMPIRHSLLLRDLLLRDVNDNHKCGLIQRSGRDLFTLDPNRHLSAIWHIENANPFLQLGELGANKFVYIGRHTSVKTRKTRSCYVPCHFPGYTLKGR